MGISSEVVVESEHDYLTGFFSSHLNLPLVFMDWKHCAESQTNQRINPVTLAAIQAEINITIKYFFLWIPSHPGHRKFTEK